jgi:hypothetical protein
LDASLEWIVFFITFLTCKTSTMLFISGDLVAAGQVYKAALSSNTGTEVEIDGIKISE